MLVRLKGIGPQTAAVLWSEGLFRRFDNRRQVAAYAGLAPTPWQSGPIDHEQRRDAAALDPFRLAARCHRHFFTGNNIGPRGDLASRGLHVRLEVAPRH
jgi:transposase